MLFGPEGAISFGVETAAADVNGDGWYDLVTGDILQGETYDMEGEAYVYEGTGAGFADVPSWTGHGTSRQEYFGEAIASAGDTNADGYEDVVFGVRAYHGGDGSDGRAYVYLGGPTGLGEDADWVMESTEGGAHLGRSVDGVGDIDGDGFDDILVSAPDASEGGKTYLIRGSPSGPNAEPAWVGNGDEAVGGIYGTSVAGVGDINADGYSDFMVSDYLWSNPETYEGGTWLYLGSPVGPGEPAWRAESDEAGNGFDELAAAGDVNGDGLADLLIGGPFDTFGATPKVALYLGPSAGIDNDGDGHGPTSAGGDDCDDADPTRYPGAPERCDGLDQDCDELADEDPPDGPAWYLDADGDLYGDPNTLLRSCVDPGGRVSDGTDCDDTRSDVHPGTTEVCDPLDTDEDCDTLVDDADPGVDSAGFTTWYSDSDADGWGGAAQASCDPPAGAPATGGDCDDTDPAVHPGALELCGDGLDNDCDPESVDSCPDTGPDSETGGAAKDTGCACGSAPTGRASAWLVGLLVVGLWWRRGER